MSILIDLNICFLTIAICFNFVTTKVLEKQPLRRISKAALQPLHGTAYDYDYFAPQPRQSSIPTQRPLINYFNNLVQNIRLPVPYIRWNMTNPLVNLFNAGATNVIDTPVGNYNQGKIKPKRNKKTSSKPQMPKRTKKHKHTNTASEGEGEQTYQITSFSDYEEPYTVDLNPNYRTLYFYDPRTGQYYKMQSLHTNFLSTNNSAKKRQKQKNEFEEDEQLVEEPVRQEVAAQIEPPTEETSVESNDSDEEAFQQTIEVAPHDSQEIKEYEEVDVLPTDMAIGDESEEEPSLGRQSEIANQNKQHQVKIIEKLRNSLASYMTSDHFNKMRQMANTKQTTTRQSKGKSQPRRKFEYYLLQPF